MVKNNNLTHYSVFTIHKCNYCKLAIDALYENGSTFSVVNVMEEPDALDAKLDEDYKQYPYVEKWAIEFDDEGETILHERGTVIGGYTELIKDLGNLKTAAVVH